MTPGTSLCLPTEGPANGCSLEDKKGFSELKRKDILQQNVSLETGYIPIHKTKRSSPRQRTRATEGAEGGLVGTWYGLLSRAYLDGVMRMAFR